MGSKGSDAHGMLSRLLKLLPGLSRNSRGAPNVYLKSSKNNRMAEKVENRKKENEKSKIQTFKQRSLVIQRLAIQMLRNSSALQEAYIVTFNL